MIDPITALTSSGEGESLTVPKSLGFQNVDWGKLKPDPPLKEGEQWWTILATFVATKEHADALTDRIADIVCGCEDQEECDDPGQWVVSLKPDPLEEE